MHHKNCDETENHELMELKYCWKKNEMPSDPLIIMIFSSSLSTWWISRVTNSTNNSSLEKVFGVTIAKISASQLSCFGSQMLQVSFFFSFFCFCFNESFAFLIELSIMAKRSTALAACLSQPFYADSVECLLNKLSSFGENGKTKLTNHSELNHPAMKSELWKRDRENWKSQEMGRTEETKGNLLHPLLMLCSRSARHNNHNNNCNNA